MPAQTYISQNYQSTVYLINPQHTKNSWKDKFFLARKRPDGKTPRVVAVRRIERGQWVASFVTAYPYLIGKPHQ